MTEIFKAGEHVKIIKSDLLYAALGNQTGLVGTITSVPNHGAGVYVTFPHTGVETFYYLNNEFERAPGTTPTPEPLKVGDWVKVENYSTRWDGTVGHVTKAGLNYTEIKNEQHKVYALSFPTKVLVRTEEPKQPVFKAGDRVELTENYGTHHTRDVGTVNNVDESAYGGTILNVSMDNGKTCGAFATRFKHSNRAKPIPAAKFKVGDWVQVTDYSSAIWDGAKGQITMVGDYDTRDGGYSYIIECAGGKPYHSGGFDEKYLKTTTAPVVHKFKVGDLVTFNEKDNMYWQGGKARVTAVKDFGTSPYTLEIIEGPPKNSIYTDAGMTLTARDSLLEAYVEPHWTESKPVGATAQVTFNSGSPNRILTKLSADEWLHVYQHINGKGESTAKRTNKDTEYLLRNTHNLNWLS